MDEWEAIHFTLVEGTVTNPNKQPSQQQQQQPQPSPPVKPTTPITPNTTDSDVTYNPKTSLETLSDLYQNDTHVVTTSTEAKDQKELVEEILIDLTFASVSTNDTNTKFVIDEFNSSSSNTTTLDVNPKERESSYMSHEKKQRRSTIMGLYKKDEMHWYKKISLPPLC